MRKFHLILVVAISTLFFSFVLKSTIKDSFNLNNVKEKDKTEFFKKSIEASNLEGYRLRDKRVTIKFQNDFELELLSASEVSRLGIAINLNEYKSDFSSDFIMPIFNILPSGHITAGVTTTSKKQQNH